MSNVTGMHKESDHSGVAGTVVSILLDQWGIKSELSDTARHIVTQTDATTAQARVTDRMIHDTQATRP